MSLGIKYALRSIRPGASQKTGLKLPRHEPTLNAIDTPISISFAESLSPEEAAQLLETIGMLKSFTEENPDDAQSLEILKEAYWKLGREAEGLAVSRQLADTYMRLGQLSSAMLEYEGILLHQPDSPEVVSILEGLESKLYPEKNVPSKAAISMDFGVEEPLPPVPSEPAPVGTPEPSLIATSATRMPLNSRKTSEVTLESDGNDPLARFLVQHRLATQEIVNVALETVRKQNAAIDADPDTQAISAGLLDELIKAGVEEETLMASILSRTKYAYTPLEYYDIDRQIVKMLPDHLTLGRRVVPFDIVSRTMMVAIDNPFDTSAKALAQKTVDYHIQWHLASPGVLHRVLRDSYRLTA